MSPKDSELEIEIKFYLPDPARMRQRIVDLGATSRGRCFEHNVRFDNANHELRNRSTLLRLRRDRDTTLTYKARPADRDDRFKVYRELEVAIDDFDKTRKILHALGFNREQIYDKWREVFTLEDLQFCMDDLPFGSFLEIEGHPPDIVKYADRLDLDWHKRILTNYLAMYESVKRYLNLPYSDVTFDNFQNSADLPPDFMQQFEAGA